MLLRVLGTLLWYAGGIVCLVALLLLLLFVADLYTYVPFTRAAKRGLRLGNVRYKVSNFETQTRTCAGRAHHIQY